MANITQSIYKMRFLDEQADRYTVIHNLHPLSKLLVTAAFLIITASFGKYSLGSLVPLIFYLIITISLSDLPVVPLLKRVLPVVPFVLGIGIFNPIFDTGNHMLLAGMPITGGWISFLVLAVKCILMVLAAFILIATTGINGIAEALRQLMVPKIFTLQLLLTYRYISVLAEEAGNIWNAYSLRAPGQKGIRFGAWGPLAGQLLLRTFDRAQRLYNAMELRGFKGEYNTGKAKAFSMKDFIYTISWIAFFTITRAVNIPEIIGLILTGGGK